LNISATASDEEVNMAYQRKVAEFQPDRILSIAHSEAFITFAREQFQKITHAYETICKARNMN
jgi:DnaJ like chaperone protein